MSEKESEEREVDKKDGGAVTVVLRADLHCEGCAHKVKQSIKKHFRGVEKVKAEYESGKVTVVGKVDPAKVKERVEKKTKKPAQLLSPKPANKVKIDNGVKNSDEKKPDSEEIKPKQVGNVTDLAVTTIVLKTRVHCDRCVNKINKIINRYEGVEEVSVDLENDKITVKGKMEMKAMLPYLNTKLKRVVEIAPPPMKNDVSNKKPKEDGGGDKKGKEAKVSKLASGRSGGKDKIKKEQGGGEDDIKGEQEEEEPKTTSSGGTVKKPPEENTASKINEVVNKMEVKGTNGDEYGAHTYDPQQAQGKGYVVKYWNTPDYADASSQFYFHTPQMFSDENPNGCSVM